MSRLLHAFGVAAICLGSVVAGVAILRANDEQETRAKEAIEDGKRVNEFADVAQRFNELMDQKRFPEAAELAKKAIKLQPKNPVAEVMVFNSQQAVRDSLQQKDKGRGAGSPTGRLMFGVGLADAAKGDLPRGSEVKGNLELQEDNFDLIRRSGVADPGQREALGKFIENLKNEAAELEKAGKKEVAEQKRQSARTLEAVFQEDASKTKDSASDIDSKQRDLETVKGDSEFADMAQKFNELMNQQRFPEAEILAKQARLLQPENPVAEAMYFKAKRAAEDWFNKQTEFLKGQLERGRNELEQLLIGSISLSKEGGATAKFESEIERRQEDISRIEREIEQSRVDHQVLADHFEKAGRRVDAEQARKMAGELEAVLREHFAASSPAAERAVQLKMDALRQSEAARRERLARGESSTAPFVPYEPMQQRAIQLTKRKGEKARLEQSEAALRELLSKKEALIAAGRLAEAESLEGAIVVRKADVAGSKAANRGTSFYALNSTDIEGAGNVVERKIVDQPDIRFTSIRVGDGQIRFDENRVAREIKLRELLHRWRALEESAAGLQRSGVEDQSRAVSEAAKKTRDEYYRLRREGVQELENAQLSSQPPGAPSHLSVASPELLRTLTELRDQVQALRKEVGHVRELLEKRQ